jgi:hypothetical protein
MDWNKLTGDIANAARTAFRDVKAANAGEEFYAFALYTDSSAMTVVAAANSLQAFDKAAANASDKSPASLAYYKWVTSEWAHEAWKAEEFKAISAELRNSTDRDQFATFKANTFRAMIDAMKMLDGEHLFEDGISRDKIALFVTVTDDDQAEAIENDSASQLNPPTVYQAFLNRFDSP